MLNFNSKFKTSLGILSIMVVVNLVLSIALLNSGDIGVSSYIFTSMGLVFLAGLIIGIKIGEVHWKTAIVFLVIEIMSYSSLTESIGRAVILLIGMAVGVFILQMKNKNRSLKN